MQRSLNQTGNVLSYAVNKMLLYYTPTHCHSYSYTTKICIRSVQDKAAQNLCAPTDYSECRSIGSSITTRCRPYTVLQALTVVTK